MGKKSKIKIKVLQSKVKISEINKGEKEEDSLEEVASEENIFESRLRRSPRTISENQNPEQESLEDISAPATPQTQAAREQVVPYGAPRTIGQIDESRQGYATARDPGALIRPVLRTEAPPQQIGFQNQELANIRAGTREDREKYEEKIKGEDIEIKRKRPWEE